MGARRVNRPAVVVRSRPVLGLVAFFMIAGSILLSLSQVVPPNVLHGDVPPTRFAAGRAMQHVEVLSTHPRPAGSAAHDAARDYLVAQLEDIGLQPEQQTTFVSDGVSRAGYVTNIVARIQGQDGGRSLLLVTGYASSRVTPGASAASGVATVLEVVRALMAERPLRHTVVVVFADGDDLAARSVEAVRRTMLADMDVGVIMRIGARGLGGVATITGAIPVAASFAEQPFHLPWALLAPPFVQTGTLQMAGPVPERMDVEGVPELAIAFGGRWTGYNTSLDTSAHLDPRSLQHHGDTLLAVVRAVGNGEWSGGGRDTKLQLLVFGQLLAYSDEWLWHVTGGIGLGLSVVILIGLWQRRLRVGAIVGGTLGCLALIAASGTMTWLVLLVAGMLWVDQMRTPHGATHGSHLLALAVVTMTISLTSAGVAMLRRHLTLHNLVASVELLWFSLLVAASRWQPVVALTMQVLVLSGLVALALLCLLPRSWLVGAQLIGGLLVVVPAALVAAPMIYLAFEWLPLTLFVWIAVVVALFLLLTAPLLDLPLHARSQWLPGLTGLATIALLLWSGVTSNHSPTHPRYNSIFYYLDTNTGTASWATLDRALDEWTALVLDRQPESGRLGDLLPINESDQILRAPAPIAVLEPARAQIENDRITNGERLLTLRVFPTETSSTLVVGSSPESRLSSAEVEGHPVRLDERTGRLELTLTNVPPDGTEVMMAYGTEMALVITIVAVVDGLPVFAEDEIPPRSADMAVAEPLDSSSLVAREFRIEPRVEP